MTFYLSGGREGEGRGAVGRNAGGRAYLPGTGPPPPPLLLAEPARRLSSTLAARQSARETPLSVELFRVSSEYLEG